jgi:hypothetical protein
MLDRKIIESLRKWAISPLRKPLVLRGARQVGKTTAVKIFAGDFEDFIDVNLERPGETNFFKRNLPVREIYQAILSAKNISPQNGKQLLFIDEIQNCPEALNSLRYFYEEMPELHVIAAGSLLEAIISRSRINFPAGRVEFLSMYPLNFREFIAALGENQALNAYETIPLPEYAFESLLKLFHQYALIGGMPEAVSAYQVKRELNPLLEIYRSLLTSFLDDIPKYAKNQTQAQVLRHCLETLPFEAGKRISYAGFGKSHYKSREAGEAIKTLERAMLIYLLQPTTNTEIPIIPDLRKSPRLQFLDTGLLNYAVGIQNQFFLMENLHSVYKGALAEHLVGQELISLESGYMNKPCFWVREKAQASAEVDFLINHKNYAIPVEVKAGASGTLRSIHQFMDACPHQLAVRLYSGPLAVSPCRTIKGKAFKLLNLPYFLTAKINEYIEWAGISLDPKN